MVLEHKGLSAASRVPVRQHSMVAVARCTYLVGVMIEHHRTQASDGVTALVVGHQLSLEY